MAALISKPGITNASVLAIPKTWDGTWFRSFVNSQLTGADVRNAIAGPGITITGNLSTPYATISAGGAGAPFTAPIIVKTSAGVTVFEVFNSTTGPTIEAYGPNAGGLVDMTPDTGTFTATGAGFSGTAPTFACRWRRVGGMVTLSINTGGTTVTGTSNATTFALTGLPSEIQTAAGVYDFSAPFFTNNGAQTNGSAQINSASGTITLFAGTSGSASSWTASGAKGLNGNLTISYLTD